MIRNYFLILFRNLWKNKLFVLINIVGMGISIALCFVAFINWDFAASWDKHHINSNSIYRIQFWREFQGHRERHAMAPMPLAMFVKESFANVQHAVRYLPEQTNFKKDDDLFRTEMAYTDSTFFDLFTYTFIEGNAQSIYDKSKIAISEELALKYFNSTNVIGRQFSQVVEGSATTKEYTIGGVFKQQPFNSSFRFDAITQIRNFFETSADYATIESDWRQWCTLFVKLENSKYLSDVTSQLQAYVEVQNKARRDFKVEEFYLEHFPGMMAKSREAPRVQNDWLRQGLPQEAVIAPAVMAVLLLLLSCFNFTNTSIAIAGKRLKEIGVRKVMGSGRVQLIFQFFGEASILCFLALLVGLLIVPWLIPAYDNLWSFLEFDFKYADHPEIIIVTLGILLVTALIAGSYPALYVTSFEPVSILKGKVKYGGIRTASNLLLFGQLAISFFIIVIGVTFFLNGRYQKTFDLGFASRGTLLYRFSDDNEYTTFRDAISTNHHIEAIGGAEVSLLSPSSVVSKYESLERDVHLASMGEGYAEAMNMSLIKGRWFLKDSETDKKESVLVTEEFVKQFGWYDNPLGKKIILYDSVQVYVVGVVKDIYSASFWKPIKPFVIRFSGARNNSQMAVRATEGKTAEVNEFLKKKWKDVFPGSLYTGTFVDERLSESLSINNNVAIIFGFLGCLATLLSAIGLYALVSLNLIRRTKEIGIRRVLGASELAVGNTVNRNFILILVVSALAGCWFGRQASQWLMSSLWQYYQEPTTLSLLLSTTSLMLLAFLIGGYRTLRTIRQNPTVSLRME